MLFQEKENHDFLKDFGVIKKQSYVRWIPVNENDWMNYDLTYDDYVYCELVKNYDDICLGSICLSVGGGHYWEFFKRELTENDLNSIFQDIYNVWIEIPDYVTPDWFLNNQGKYMFVYQ